MSHKNCLRCGLYVSANHFFVSPSINSGVHGCLHAIQCGSFVLVNKYARTHAIHVIFKQPARSHVIAKRELRLKGSQQITHSASVAVAVAVAAFFILLTVDISFLGKDSICVIALSLRCIIKVLENLFQFFATVGLKKRHCEKGTGGGLYKIVRQGFKIIPFYISIWLIPI